MAREPRNAVKEPEIGASCSLAGLAGDEDHADRRHADRYQVAPETEEEFASVADGAPEGPGQLEETEHDQKGRDDEGNSPYVVGLTTKMRPDPVTERRQLGTQPVSGACFRCGHPAPPATTPAGGRPFCHLCR